MCFSYAVWGSWHMTTEQQVFHVTSYACWRLVEGCRGAAVSDLNHLMMVKGCQIWDFFTNKHMHPLVLLGGSVLSAYKAVAKGCANVGKLLSLSL